MTIRRKNTDKAEMIKKGRDIEDADLHYILNNTVINPITTETGYYSSVSERVGRTTGDCESNGLLTRPAPALCEDWVGECGALRK